MSGVIGYMLSNFMQKGLGNMLSSGGSDTKGLKSVLSELGGQVNDPNNPLVQQVQREAHLNDPNQAKRYTQEAINVIRENADNNPQDLSSLFKSVGHEKGLDDLIRGFVGGSGTQSA